MDDFQEWLRNLKRETILNGKVVKLPAEAVHIATVLKFYEEFKTSRRTTVLGQLADDKQIWKTYVGPISPVDLIKLAKHIKEVKQ